MRTPFAAALLASLALAIAACGEDDERGSFTSESGTGTETTGTGTTGTTGTTTPEKEATGEAAKTFSISETEFKLSPADFKLAKAGTVEFVVKNDGRDHARARAGGADG